MDRFRKIFGEVARRRVLATTALYVVAAWASIQVADLSIAAGLLHWPLRSVFVAAFLGFPIALIIAWFYDITRKGIVRTAPFSAPADFDRSLGKRDIALLMSLAIVWVVANILVYVPAPVDRSIAVLAFENRGHDPQGADLAFGIRLDLQSQLETLQDVRVITSSSVDDVDMSLPVAVIAQELGVAFILKGTVERVLDRIRVSVTLIDARNDEQAFSSSWDRRLELNSLFDIRDDIVAGIIRSLGAGLTLQGQERVEARQTDNFAAHQAYLLGRQRMARRATNSLAEAVEYFEQAIDLDPHYARAWVGLAESSYLHMMYGNLPRDVWFPRIEAANNRAHELDRLSGEAYAITAILQEELYGNDIAAEQAFLRAIDLSPNYATAHHWYGSFLSVRGRAEEALALKQAALELDPLGANTNLVVGYELQGLGRFDEAMDFFHRAIEIDPAVPASYERIADIHYSVYGRLDQAIAWQFEAIARDPNELMGPVYLILMYLSLGAVDEAEQWVDRVVRKAPPGFPFIERLYEPVYLRRGEVEASLEIARQAIQFDPQGRYTLMNLRDDDLRAGRYLDARARYARAVPELLEDDVPAVDHRNLELAIDLALVLQNTGEEERANLLLQGSLEVMQTMHRLGGGYGISDVMTHALLGHTDQALLALRSAIDAGWRENWWIYLEHDENLSSIRGRPEFQAIVEEVKADMATQLARVRELQAGGTLPEISDF